jgi:nitrogen fixation protein NifU and related proteins
MKPGELTLYREIVLEHTRHPRNCRRPPAFDREAEGHNTLCGDKVRVFLTLHGDSVADVAFEASACAIATASASLMTEAVKGQPLAEARRAVDAFVAVLNGDGSGHLAGDLEALESVREYPSRVRCATLPWQTLRSALDARVGTVTTE